MGEFDLTTGRDLLGHGKRRGICLVTELLPDLPVFSQLLIRLTCIFSVSHKTEYGKERATFYLRCVGLDVCLSLYLLFSMFGFSFSLYIPFSSGFTVPYSVLYRVCSLFT